MEERKTLALAELAQKARAADGRGLRCPKCQCQHFRKGQQNNTEVDRTIPEGPNNSIRRWRICRNCGAEFPTYEKVVGF